MMFTRPFQPVRQSFSVLRAGSDVGVTLCELPGAARTRQPDVTRPNVPEPVWCSAPEFCQFTGRFDPSSPPSAA